MTNDDDNCYEPGRYCRCAEGWDIRCMCAPGSDTYAYCPYRIENGVWLINNEYDWYERVQHGDFDFARLWFREGANGTEDWIELKAAWLDDWEEGQQ